MDRDRQSQGRTPRSVVIVTVASDTFEFPERGILVEQLLLDVFCR